MIDGKNKKRLCILAFFLCLSPFFVLEALSYYTIIRKRAMWQAGTLDEELDKQEIMRLEGEKELLQKSLERLAPKGIYIVIDTGGNVLYLKNGSTILRKAIISSGSGNVLLDPGGQRKWTFDTPRGEFDVRSKIKNPYWIKPDWAFIEEGKEIPKASKDRVEEGVLGDYALGFGKGYFIHGTLYTRLLGRNVTHGCVRVGDEDLLAIYNTAPLGAKIFIF